MKKILLIICILLCAFTSHAFLAVKGERYESSGGGGTTTKWVGFQNTDGTPSAAIGSLVSYGSDADRAYSRYWAATEGGTAVAISVRWGDPVGGGGGTPDDGYYYLVLYNGTTLVGYADPSGTFVADTWVRYTLIVSDGQSLDFSTSDNLYFGVAHDAAGVSAGTVSVDNGGPMDVTYYDSTNSITMTPNTTVTWSGPSAAGGFCSILEYTTP
jgi:hypothetical protein